MTFLERLLFLDWRFRLGIKIPAGVAREKLEHIATDPDFFRHARFPAKLLRLQPGNGELIVYPAKYSDVEIVVRYPKNAEKKVLYCTIVYSRKFKKATFLLLGLITGTLIMLLMYAAVGWLFFANLGAGILIISYLAGSLLFYWFRVKRWMSVVLK